MSKRPTFRDLLLAYGAACANSKDDHEGERENAAYEALTRALRKSGLPLDQVAPQ